MKDSAFSRPAIIFLAAFGTALFAAAALLSAYGGPVSDGRAYAPGTYSVSALGHAGFYDVLRRLGRPAVRSAGDARAAAGTRGVLIVAEPEWRSFPGAEALNFRSVKKLLLVLPKWRGVPDKKRPSWVAGAEPVSLSQAQITLNLVAGPQSLVFRERREPGEWAVNDIGIELSAPVSVQLIRSDEMRPVVGDEDGMLVGEISGAGPSPSRIWVLSDPDILSNHGIVRGGNAAFMTALVDALRLSDDGEADAPVVFDETVHGFEEPQGSPAALLFRFPFAAVTALACAAAALLALSGMGRFGAPVPLKAELDFGKARLIDNSARLLDYAGHHAVVLKGYVRMTAHSAASALRAPRLDEPALVQWLDRIGRARGVQASCAEILRTADAQNSDKAGIARLFKSAGDIYAWKREILGDNEGSADGRIS